MTAPARQPIATAPRDGSLIVVGSDDVGEFVMRWWAFQRNAIFAPGVTGMWVDPYAGFTWTEHGGGGPEYWKPYSPAELVEF